MPQGSTIARSRVDALGTEGAEETAPTDDDSPGLGAPGSRPLPRCWSQGCGSARRPTRRCMIRHMPAISGQPRSPRQMTWTPGSPSCRGRVLQPAVQVDDGRRLAHIDPVPPLARRRDRGRPAARGPGPPPSRVLPKAASGGTRCMYVAPRPPSLQVGQPGCPRHWPRPSERPVGPHRWRLTTTAAGRDPAGELGPRCRGWRGIVKAVVLAGFRGPEGLQVRRPSCQTVTWVPARCGSA